MDIDLAPVAELVVVDWNELLVNQCTTDSNNVEIASLVLQSAINRAYGSDGTGILAIRNVPGFVEAKQKFLPMAHKLINLPESYLEENLSDPVSMYNVGWSRGKEKLGKDKPVDTSKGSYYFNPITDHPGSVQDRLRYPVSYPCNKWPDEQMIPSFRSSACALGHILQMVAIEVARHVDYVVGNRFSSTSAKCGLYSVLQNTEKVKCRLLYYYPLDDDVGSSVSQPGQSHCQRLEVAEDSWIGWHNDSGFLTALAGELYVDHDTGEIITTDSVEIDPAAGLYIVDRSDIVRRVRIPPDCIAVQIGECTQILTGGAVVATPHCVRGIRPHYHSSSDVGRRRKIARISLPCFVDTAPHYVLAAPSSTTRQKILSNSNPSCKVPPLQSRWTSSEMTFGDFLQKTFETYYDWNA
jgi:isopenicillin N synthase-like dioxygenase